MSDSNDPFNLWFLGTAAGAAIVGFFLSPILRFMDLELALLSALMLATGFFVIVSAGMLSNTRRRVHIGFALTLAGVCCLTYEATNGLSASGTNDNRCAAIQRMMLAPNPIRSDGPDLFQALGCRPQNLPFTEWPTKVKRNPRPVAGG